MKTYKRGIFEQMCSVFDKLSLKDQCWFQERFSTQQFHLAILQKWKKLIDPGKSFGDKAFDFLKHGFLSQN